MAKTDFYPLVVSDVRKETSDTVSVAFALNEALKSEFGFEAGQYITFKYNHQGEEIRRSYSICVAPVENELRVAIKKVEGGIFSTFANEVLKAGDTIECMPPMGNFTTEINPKHDKNYIAFAAGSGITPVMSIMKTVLDEEPESSFSLVYGNKEFQSIIFREEIEALKNKYMGRLQVIHILSRERLESELNNGRIDKDKCDGLCTSLIDISTFHKAFLCGPEEMILSVKDFLIEKGMDKSAVKFELFNTGLKKDTKEVVATENIDNNEMSEITIKVDDRTFDINLGREGASILDAALMKGADLPYACKGGVCCTCKAKVLEGEVAMDVNYALEEDEVAQGYILSCQAHPISKKVVVDFDVS